MCAKYARPTSYDGRQGNQKFTGAVRAANATEAAAATSTDLYISPVTLASAVGDLVPSATTLIEGVVLITDNTSPVATKAYADALAIAGAPAWSETVSGIGQLSTTAEAQAGTDDNTAMTPAKVVDLLETPPAIGGTTPGAGSFTTLAASGLASLSASATILTAGAALNLGSDNSGDAVNLGVGTVARAIGIGNSAAAHVVTLGSVTGASQVIINSGTAGIQMASTGAGDITIDSDDTVLIDSDGVLELNSSAGVISIGNDDVDQNINLGSDGERVITIGSNNGAAQVDLEAGSGGVNISTAASAQSVSIGNNTGATAIALEVGTGNFTLDGVGASTYGIGSATTTGTITLGGTAQSGLLSIGDSSASLTIEIGDGEGATQIDIGGGGTAANDINIAGGAVASTVNIGSASAGAIAVDTAAGISLDAATASNFTVSAALADLTLQSSAGRVVVKGEEAAVSAVELVSAAGGISASSALQLSLISSEAAAANAVRIQSSAADGGIDIDGGTGGIAIDSTGALSLQGAAASDFSVSGAGIDLTLASASGRVIVDAGEDAADTIYLHADAGTSEKIRLHSDQGTAVDSVELESDVGGITLLSGLASADAINLISTNGGIDCDSALQFNIASSQADAGAITLSASNASGGITHTGKCIFTPDAITSDNAGVAASVSTFLTQITTDGDSNLDNVTLADGVDGQIKMFAVVAAGNAADSVKITPANMAGGTQITFSADPTGLGCTMAFDGTNWTVVANNGGTIA